MDFTDLYRHTNAQIAFSPGRHFILTAINDRIVVRKSSTFTITASFQADLTPSTTSSVLAGKPSTKFLSAEASITQCAWSPDSEYILAACPRRGIVNVFALRDTTWNARIEAGVEGLMRAEWAPDSRHILCFSEFGLRVTIWSLVTGTATYIQYPKFAEKGHTFRKDGKYFVLAERRKSKDVIGLYDASDSYKLARQITLPTSSLGGLSLSPTGNYLAIWDGPLDYKLYIYNLSGQQIAAFEPEEITTLGIRTVTWHPSGLFLAVGGWDDRIHLLTSFSWTRIATIQLTSRLPSGVSVWREPEPSWLTATHNRGFIPYTLTTTSSSFPVSLPIQKPTPPTSTAPSPSFPKSGTNTLEFSPSGAILLACFDQAPACALLYAFPGAGEPFYAPRLRSVLWNNLRVGEGGSPMRARMSPEPTRDGTGVGVCTGAGAVYLWSDARVLDLSAGSGASGTAGPQEERGEIAECIAIPAQKFACRDLKWAPDGKGLILLDKETFCCAFEVEDEEIH